MAIGVLVHDDFGDGGGSGGETGGREVADVRGHIGGGRRSSIHTRNATGVRRRHRGMCGHAAIEVRGLASIRDHSLIREGAEICRHASAGV